MTDAAGFFTDRDRAVFTLANAAERGANSYSVLRIIAAVLVIWTHSFSVVGGPDAAEPLKALTGWSIGSHAVNIFFALSGFMVAASWERSRNLADFVMARALRVVPALVCVNLFILIFAGIFLTTVSPSEFWSVENAGGFLANTLLLFKASSTLVGVFADNPWQHFVNIPIWTIKFELLCYATLAIIMVLVGLFRPSATLCKLGLGALFGACVIVMLWKGEPSQFEFAGNFARFLFAFYLGVAAWFARHRIVLSASYLMVISLPLAAAIAVGSTLVFPLSILAAAYLSFWAGSFQTGLLQRAADRTDLSYGLYIFGFFIQQYLVYVFPGQSVTANAITATVLAGIFAWISWTLIERPALDLRSKFWRGRAASRSDGNPSLVGRLN